MICEYNCSGLVNKFRHTTLFYHFTLSLTMSYLLISRDYISGKLLISRDNISGKLQNSSACIIRCCQHYFLCVFARANSDLFDFIYTLSCRVTMYFIMQSYHTLYLSPSPQRRSPYRSLRCVPQSWSVLSVKLKTFPY